MSDVEVPGYRIELGEGRSVWVGRIEGDPSFFVQLVNAGGIETKFRISQEAASALRDLLWSEACAGSPEAIAVGCPEWQWRVLLAPALRQIEEERSDDTATAPNSTVA